MTTADTLDPVSDHAQAETAERCVTCDRLVRDGRCGRCGPRSPGQVYDGAPQRRKPAREARGGRRRNIVLSAAADELEAELIADGARPDDAIHLIVAAGVEALRAQRRRAARRAERAADTEG